MVWKDGARQNLAFFVVISLKSLTTGMYTKEKPIKYIMEKLSSAPFSSRPSFTSPFTADPETHLNSDFLLHWWLLLPVEELLDSSTEQRAQDRDKEEAGWGTCVKKSVVTKTRSEENYWQMKLLFDKQFKQEEYLAEGFQGTVLDS